MPQLNNEVFGLAFEQTRELPLDLFGSGALHEHALYEIDEVILDCAHVVNALLVEPGPYLPLYDD